MDEATLEAITAEVRRNEEEVEEINPQIAVIQERVAEVDLNVGRLIFALSGEIARRNCPPVI